MNNPNFDLAEFSYTNLIRCNDPAAFNCGQKGNLYFAVALAEEVGEIAGIIKKLERGFNKREFKKILPKFVKEYNKTSTEITEAELEYSNIVHRHPVHQFWLKEKKEALAKEIADVFTYLDLLASKNDINLWQAAQDKFNSVSKEMGCPQYKIENK